VNSSLLSSSYWLLGLGVVALILFIFARPALASVAPKVGEPAPGFSLLDQNGTQRSLEDYKGKWLVLYFYPKDDTPGCTTEACHFRDDYYLIKSLGAVVVGVSLDDVSSHKEFSEKFSLPFSLLADGDHEMAKAYSVLTGFGPFHFARRQTFIIDPQGNIARHYANVRPKQHAAQVIDDLKGFIAKP